jgi:hypothetical protein
MQTCNPRTWKADEGGQYIWDQPGLQSEDSDSKKKKKLLMAGCAGAHL